MTNKVTYRQQVTYCGKGGCRKCREGVGHGPYWYAYSSNNGRTVRTYIGKKLPATVEDTIQVESNRSGTPKTSPLFKLYLLGQFRLERQLNWKRETASELGQHRSVRSLLGYLISSPGRKRGREQVMDTLWPDLDVETAANRLNSTVHLSTRRADG